MAKQLVVSGNKILAYGEDCFTVMGESVKCSNKGNEYQNATVTTCEEFPPDIGKVGYEYHAGQFVPCAPFGEGVGNIAVFCDACNTMKNSGFPISSLFNPGHIYETTRTGTNKYGSTNKSTLKDPLPFVPKVLFVARKDGNNYGILFNGYGISFDISEGKLYELTTDLSTTTPTWYSKESVRAQLNSSNGYTIIAIG